MLLLWFVQIFDDRVIGDACHYCHKLFCRKYRISRCLIWSNIYLYSFELFWWVSNHYLEHNWKDKISGFVLNLRCVPFKNMIWQKICVQENLNQRPPPCRYTDLSHSICRNNVQSITFLYVYLYISICISYLFQNYFSYCWWWFLSDWIRHKIEWRILNP